MEEVGVKQLVDIALQAEVLQGVEHHRNEVDQVEHGQDRQQFVK